ncbi:MAG: beta-ketoacyl synthase N-terminal-like domain-containing protein, partial [Myxococcota bacterium]|nr:beta-ketoacyl synthase N-terminal-like domain-containing protein [Myxococcota bacterium]
MSKELLDVAIVGIGAKTPIGLSPAEFWEGVVARRDGVRDVPPDRWDPEAYYDPDPKTPDKTYSKIGGFVVGFEFDRKRYRLPPAVADAMDRSQRLALAAVDEALADAGPDVDRERCAVILGNALGGDRRELTSARVLFPAVVRALASSEGWDDLPADLRDKLVRSMERSYKADLPTVTEDTMPGELSNCIAGRIANVLDLGGSNYTVDAACASSLAALSAAGRALRAGECDVAVTGGADTVMGAPTYVKFCKIGALSPDRSRPFDAGANGFVMGEGVAAFVLKRVEDAERDGDRIYAVVRSVGSSSDGRGKGITAPNPVGQRRAVRRAYAAAGIDPATVDLIEAHGTSTRVGDATEAAVLHEIWGDSRKADPVAIGSVKSQIGHLKSAAGAVGTLKAALAIHNRVLPPSINFERENPECSLPGSSFRVQTEVAEWPEPRGGGPRRAAVSAFGFGGTNFHVVIEEWRAKTAKTQVFVPGAMTETQSLPGREIAMAQGAETTTTSTYAMTARHVTREEIEKALVDVLCAKTGYDPAEIQLDFELEADLGVDTVKQAEILAAVRERYALPRDEKFRLADYPRLADLAEYVLGRVRAEEAEAARGDVAPVGTTAGTGTGTGTMAIHAGDAGFQAAGEGFQPTTSADEGGGSGQDDPEIAGEVLRASASSREELVDRLRDIAARAGRDPSLASLAASAPEGRAGAWRVAFAPTSAAEAVEQAGRAVDCLETGKGRTTLPAKGIFLRTADDPPASGNLAFLFPGQGSQWVGMCKALARRYPVVAETLRRADEVMAPILGRPLTAYVFGEGFGEGGADPEAALRMTTITQPAMVACDVAIARALARHGIRPDMVAGHSLGEYAAGVTAGVLDFDESLRIVAARGREMAAATPAGGDPGWMAAVAAPVETVEEVIAATEGYIVAANKNSPSQTIVAGASDAVQRAMATFAERRIPCVRLPVSHAFHSAVVASASAPLRKVLDASAVRPPAIPILSNVTAGPYPADPDGIRALLARQVASPVEFIGIVRRMAADGATVFVEAGPKKALTGFVGEILAGSPMVACATNLPKRGDVRSFLEALALLWVEGLDVRFSGDAPEVAPNARSPKFEIRSPKSEIVVTGMALGCPGSDDPFAADNFDRMLAGHTMFDQVPAGIRERMVRQNVVRVFKDERGEPRLAPVSSADDVIRLAARGRPVELVEEYGVPDDLAATYDSTTRLAVAAAFEALRDAGLPLARSRRPTRNGGFVGSGRRLPESVGGETGVIFASAFPGHDRLIAEVERRAAGGETGPFPRNFLLEVLALGHAQVASLVGALGPNVQVNAACASTSLAISIAEDWIRCGRCRRVIVVGA